MRATTPLQEALQAEAVAELRYLPVGVTLDLNRTLPDGCTYQKYAKKLKAFAESEPLPDLLQQVPEYADAFCAEHEFDGALKEGAELYIASRVWQHKIVYADASLKEKITEAQKMRDEKQGLHIAVARHVKHAPPDAYPHYLQAKFNDLMLEAGAHVLLNALPESALARLTREGDDDDL